MRGRMGFFSIFCALHLVQDLVALIDAWPGLLLASKTQCVVDVTDDASVFEMELRRKIERGGHGAKTPGSTKSSPSGAISAAHCAAHHGRKWRAARAYCALRALTLDLFRVTAARMSVFSAASSIVSPSRKSMARLVFPSRLALNRREGSFSAAPLAKVIFTTLL